MLISVLHFSLLSDNTLTSYHRLAVEAWGLKNCTQKDEWFSDTVTAVVVPPYIDSSEVVRRAWKRYNLSLGLGLNKVAGKVFRIGHLGNLNEVCCHLIFNVIKFCCIHIDQRQDIVNHVSSSIHFQKLTTKLR